MPCRSPRSRRRAGLAAAALLALPLTGGAWAQDYGWRRQAEPVAPVSRELELQAAGDAAERLEVGQENVQDGRIRTEPVTDVLLRIRHAVRRFRSSPLDDTSEAERSYVEAHLAVVVGGRLSAAATAQCDQFDSDVLLCTVDCNGGAFGLRRGRHPGEHHLIIGVAEAGAEGARSRDRAGFRIGSCTAMRDRPGLLVLPRTGRLATEIRLVERR